MKVFGRTSLFLVDWKDSNFADAAKEFGGKCRRWEKKLKRIYFKESKYKVLQIAKRFRMKKTYLIK